METRKIKDFGTDTSSFSKVDQYWAKKGLNQQFRNWRTPSLNKLPITEKDNYAFLLDKLQFNSIEFGNWVNNQWRFTYLMGAVIAFYDINKVLGFNYNIGLSKTLGLAFGSRGNPNALAHFEPGTMMINISRFSRDASDPFTAGGVGSLAHEYGHALDYFFGSRFSNKWSLSKGTSVSTRFEEADFTYNSPQEHMVVLMNHIIYTIIYSKEKTFTTYYVRLKRAIDSEYWFRHNELFARAFEQYIHFKLEQTGVKNRLLNKRKYSQPVYLDTKTFEAVAPKMEALLKVMKSVVASDFKDPI